MDRDGIRRICVNLRVSQRFKTMPQNGGKVEWSRRKGGKSEAFGQAAAAAAAATAAAIFGSVFGFGDRRFLLRSGFPAGNFLLLSEFSSF